MKYSDVAEYMGESAINYMKSVIKEADGNEVFFICKIDENLMITDADEVARGNKSAVPAILHILEAGDIVVHNHPTGDLTPSDVDLNIASSIGQAGNGFYIVDNQLAKVNVVVKAFLPEKLCPLNKKKLEEYFMENGSIAAGLEGYEYRKEQVDMLGFVADCFNRNKIGIVEAGTGTGKSFSYLLPSILWSLVNKEKVIISTNTINLQEQLFYKDIPQLRKMTGIDFKWCLIKGRANYVCLRKVESVKRELNFLNRKEQEFLEEIIQWVGNTPEGSKSELEYIPKENVWEMVRCDADQCTRVKCSYFSRCFFYKARKKASYSNIVIANHHIVMTDIILRKITENYTTSAILPHFQRIIFDEAHHLEDVATSNMGMEISRFRLSKIFSRILKGRKKGKKSGLLPFIEKLIYSSRKIPQDKKHLVLRELGDEVIPALSELQQEADPLFKEIEKVFTGFLKPSSENTKFRITFDIKNSDFWMNSAIPLIKELCGCCVRAGGRLKEFLGLLDKEDFLKSDRIKSPVIELRSIIMRFESVARDFGFFIENEDEHCRWVEFKKGGKSGPYVKLGTSPVIVAKELKEFLYGRYKTILMTSATLSIEKDFSFIKNRTGLDLVEKPRVKGLVLESPFNYEQQAFVGIPKRIAEPGTAGYVDMLKEMIFESIKISKGRSLVLFTSYYTLETVWALLKGKIEKMGYTVLKQGELNRYKLLERFKRDSGSVLLATESFWEGIDVKGDSLKLLIITRLPFKVPTEPVQVARAEYIEMSGGNPFREYSLPQAVIKFKQGFGRLIRHSNDTGAILVLDQRILLKSYGKSFIRSLPPSKIVSDLSEGILMKMKKFFMFVEKGE